MVIYVAHKNECFDDILHAKSMLRKLELADPDDVFICPIFAFHYLNKGDLSESKYEKLCFALIEHSDTMFVATDETDVERKHAHKCGLGVYYVE